MNRTLLMPCLVAVGLVVIALIAVGVQAETLFVALAALACPLMMLLMMGGMVRMAQRHGRKEPNEASPQEDAAARS